jgi:uncharacterized cupredoxin-like copper-binding protein
MKTLLSTGMLAVATIASGLAFAHGETQHPREAGKPSLSAGQKSFGREGDPKKVSRTINIDMSDAMRFSPAALSVRRGETVRFIVRNSGSVMHEMVLGSMPELKAHAELMKKHPGMEHAETNMAHVAPGKSEQITWQFNRPGEFYYGCLIPGHFEAGMIGKISVTK